MMLGGFFGSYLDGPGLEELKVYKYKGAGSTPIDRILNPFWEWAVTKVPYWMSPNLITLIGFACTFVCMCLTCVYAPTLSEPAPTFVYVLNFLLLFTYQTCDAIDGKQARRTNTSTPLGQLFDHGCDAFSTIFAVWSVLGTARMGITFPAFMLLAILQMQLCVYTWWEMHFHVYRCHTGVTGVTEGQLVMMAFNLLAIIFGPDIFVTSLGEALPSSMTSWVPEEFTAAPIQFYIAFPFYCLLIGMLLADAINGCNKIRHSKTAIGQLLGCLLHVILQLALYQSDLMESHSVLCFWTITFNSAILVLRLNMSATCKMPFDPIQWPVIPFWIVSVYLFISSPSRVSILPSLGLSAFSADSSVLRLMDLVHSYRAFLLLCVFVWSVVYLYDFLMSTVSLICTHLEIHCFSVGERYIVPTSKEFEKEGASKQTEGGVKSRSHKG